MGKLDGKVVLVSGGARGMGAAHAALLASEGATVALGDVLDDEGRATAAAVGGSFHHLDVTSEASWQAAVAEVEASLGPVHALVNNAGVVGYGPVDAVALEDWDRVIGINLTGTFLGIKSVAPSMRAGGGGVIVNISSTAGMVGFGNLAAYVASKWGVRGLTKAAALDLAADGIRVVSVHPGGIRTPMTDGFSDAVFADQPMPRIGEPEEIARLVLFLIADATYSTGSEFVADGGQTLGTIIRR
jgi:3alpha(or 20beta)-hydroxysteroid dehydrogenase